MSIKSDILHFLQPRVGLVVTSEEIFEATGGKVSTARRLRELRLGDYKRGIMGWDIRSNKTDESLAANEYRMASLERIPPKPPESHVMSSVTKASEDNQLAVYFWLRKKFGHIPDDLLGMMVDSN